MAVNQAGKPEYVDSQDTASATKIAQNVTISGKANSKQLTFTLGSGSLAVVLPNNYTAASLSIANGAEVTGDPGASAEYNWSVVVSVPINDTVSTYSSDYCDRRIWQ